MNYREKMREYLKEPDEYSSHYGKWGILNEEQRQMITRLLNEMDGADVYVKKLYFENEDLKQKLAVVNEMNVANYNKYCEVIEENKRLKEEYMFLQNASDEYEERLLNREAELLDRIYKAQIFIQQNIRDIDYDTEEYDYLMKILGGDVDE